MQKIPIDPIAAFHPNTIYTRLKPWSRQRYTFRMVHIFHIASVQTPIVSGWCFVFSGPWSWFLCLCVHPQGYLLGPGILSTYRYIKSLYVVKQLSCSSMQCRTFWQWERMETELWPATPKKVNIPTFDIPACYRFGCSSRENKPMPKFFNSSTFMTFRMYIQRP